MPADRLIAMIEDLRRLAITGSPDPISLPRADELGHRRPADVPLLAWRARRLGLPPVEAVPQVGARGVDVRLWMELAQTGGIGPGTDCGRNQTGPFVPMDRVGEMGGIEVWTETELCSLHALLWGAVLGGDRSRLAAVLAHARWHIEHTQPDNATNRPWAIHLFMVLAETDGSPEARMYAQTLAHNCRVAMGVPDVISAQILFDAAEALGAAIDAGMISG